MKNKIKYIFISLILLLTSCQTMFLSDGTPAWSVNRPKNNNKWVYFYGYGEANNAQLAKNKANIEVLDEVEDFIGSDVSETYYRELSDSSKIKIFEMELYREEVVPLSDGSYSYFVLYKASRPLLEQSFSAEYKEILETERSIETLLESALEDYKQNNDVESVSKLLNALSLSLTFPVKNEDYQSEVLLDKVLKQLSELKIKVQNVKPDVAEAEVKLVRTYGLFHPPVKNAHVSARFTTYEPLANEVESSLMYKTDDRGKFLFKPVNPYMVKEGRVTFYLDMENELYNLSLVAPPDYISKINDIISNIQTSFNYSIASNEGDGDVGIVLNEFDEEGRRLKSKYAQETFISYFKNQNIEIKGVNSAEEELTSAIDDIKLRYPNIKYLIWGRVGSVDSRIIGNEYAYSITGDIYLVNVDNGQIIKEEKLAAVTSWDEVIEVALEEGYRKYGKLVAVKFISQF